MLQWLQPCELTRCSFDRQQHISAWDVPGLSGAKGPTFQPPGTALKNNHGCVQVVPKVVTSGPPKDAQGVEDVLETTPEALLAQCVGLTILDSTLLFAGVAYLVQELPLLTMFPAVLLSWCLGQGGHFMWLLDYENGTQRPQMRVGASLSPLLVGTSQ